MSHNALSRHGALGALLTLSLATAPSVAMADAIPPPLPIKCPAGTNVVHDHGGTRCVAVAPTNCPAGWRGVTGGQCVLDLCSEDASCRRWGTTCREADLCVTEGMGYGYGAISRGSDLAAPPRPQWQISFIDACSVQKTCADGAKCQPRKVCLPAGLARPAPRPANAGVAKIAGERPLPAADAASPSPSQPTGIDPAPVSSDPVPTTSAPAAPQDAGGTGLPAAAPPGGRAGCNLGSQQLPVPQAIALLVAMAVTFVRRKR